MLVQCGICLNHCSLESESFSIFPCGHGFCTECISKLFSVPRPKCPNCRVPLHEGDAHPVYIDFIDTLTILGNILSEVDELHQIGADTPLMDIEEASQKLRRISNAWKERVTELEQENAFYEVMLNKHTYRAYLQEAKNKELSRQVTALKKKLARMEKESTLVTMEDVDDST